MQKLADAIVILSFILGASFGGAYGTRWIFHEVQKAALSKKLSPTEPFAQDLTNEKLPF